MRKSDNRTNTYAQGRNIYFTYLPRVKVYCCIMCQLDDISTKLEYKSIRGAQQHLKKHLRHLAQEQAKIEHALERLVKLGGPRKSPKKTSRKKA